MKLLILNKPGISETVPWKAAKAAPLERKKVVSVDFCLGEEVVTQEAIAGRAATPFIPAAGESPAVPAQPAIAAVAEVREFQQRAAVQRMRFPENASWATIEAAVKARARELAVASAPTAAVELDI